MVAILKRPVLNHKQDMVNFRICKLTNGWYGKKHTTCTVFKSHSLSWLSEKFYTKHNYTSYNGFYHLSLTNTFCSPIILPSRYLYVSFSLSCIIPPIFAMLSPIFKLAHVDHSRHHCLRKQWDACFSYIEVFSTNNDLPIMRYVWNRK